MTNVFLKKRPEAGMRFRGWCLACAVIPLTLAAKITTLTAVDGGTWSAGTWDNGLPESGDVALVYNPGSTAITVSNDVVPSLACLLVGGNAAVTLTGETLALTGTTEIKPNPSSSLAYVFSNGCPCTVTCPLRIAGTGIFNMEGSFTMDGDVTIDDGQTLYLYRQYASTAAAKKTQVFNGSITGLDATLGLTVIDYNSVCFKGPVRVKKATDNGYSYATGYNHFLSTGNSFGEIAMSGGQIYWEAKDATTPPVRFTWRGISDAYYRGAQWINTDQTVDGIVCPAYTDYDLGKSRKAATVMTQVSGSVLTLRNTSDADGGGARLGNAGSNNHAFSLVYDPAGDYVQRFANRTHDLTGPITVKGGTLRFEQNARFPYLTSLDVQGGAFEMAFTNEVATLPALTTLKVGATGRFVLEEMCPVSPLVADVTSLYVTSGGKVVVSNGLELVFAGIYVDGVREYPGATFTAANCDWLEGDGTVTSTASSDAVYWQANANGAWETAANWTALPQAGKTAYAMVRDNGYAITFGPAATAHRPDGFCAYGSLTKTVSLLLTGAPTVDGWSMTFGKNGTLKAGSEADALFTGSTLDFTEGATLETAGRLAFSGSRITLADSTLRITGGTVVYSNTVANPLTFGANSALEMTGGTLTFVDTAGNESGTKAPVSFDAAGLTVTASGDARIECCSTSDTYPLRSSQKMFFERADFSGQASLAMNSANFGAINGVEAEYTFREHAKLDVLRSGNGTISVGSANSSVGSVTLNLDSDQETYAPYSTKVGEYQNAVLNIRNGHTLIGCGNMTAAGGANVGDRTGIINVYDGSVTQRADSQYDRHLYGICVGDASYITRTAQKVAAGPVRGTLNVYDRGTVTNSHLLGGGAQGMYLRIGTCYAEGDFNLYGGAYEHLSRFQACVGLWGGVGRWLLASNAVARVRGDVYVGGCVTNVMCGFVEKPSSSSYGNRGTDDFFKYFDLDQRGTGTLTVESGRFLCSSNLFTSVWGAGTLAFGGNPEAFLCARSVTLSNTVASAGYAATVSTVSFTAGTNGVARLVAGSYGSDEAPVADGRLVIGAGAKLTVDLSRLTDTRTSHFPLIQYGECVGAFADIDLTHPTATGMRGELVETTYRGVRGLYYRIPRGLTVIFR